MRYSAIRLSLFGSALAMAALWSARAGLAAETFRPGEAFIVAQQSTPLMRGTETLATLSQGQRLSVLAAEGDWLGTSVVVNGQTVGGWIHKRQAATPTQYAQRMTTRRRYSYQSDAAEGGGYVGGGYSRGYSRSSSGERFIMGHTPYGPSYWRADRKIKGY
ncbi:MAG TPA: hypothetical protein VG826_02075 [Pirellulales bacterium]|nr:hypothetical protein [Pirellulales bacterium]